MNLTIYIDYELSKFIKDINKQKKWNLEYSSFTPQYTLSNVYRCVGRIWDKHNWDINKQCKRKVYGDNIVCKMCFNKKSIYGLVNERPDEQTILYWYRKGLENKQKKTPRGYGITTTEYR